MFDREILSWLEYGGRSCKIFWSDYQKFYSLLYSWVLGSVWLWFDLIVSLFPSDFLLFPWLLCHDSFLQRQLPIGVLKQGVLRNFTKFTGNHLYERSFLSLLKKILWHRCFLLNFVKVLKTAFYIEHLWWLLLFLPYAILTYFNFILTLILYFYFILTLLTYINLY